MSKTFLPHATAEMTVVKLSSIIMISLALLQTSVPVIFIEKPTSAYARAGASFVESPITATVLSKF